MDLTGYWVSIVTEDWRYRMLVAKKGDYSGVPMKPETRKLAEAWDPAKDEAAGEQCKPYGAAALMRMPGRIHVTWENDSTLRVDTDAGTQMRRFHFGGSPPAAEAPSWQGYSVASWEGTGAPGRAPQGKAGALKVVTTHLRPGYLRRNGVPYSATAALTEYYNVVQESNGDQWLFITTVVEDPAYLTDKFITSTNFRKEADGSKWHLSPCTLR